MKFNMKQFVIHLFVLLHICTAASAQEKGDSIFVTEYGWKILSRSDSVYHIKTVSVENPDSISVETRVAKDYDLLDWRDKADNIVLWDSLQLNADLGLTGMKMVTDFDQDYIFIDSDRYATVYHDHTEGTTKVEYNLWQTRWYNGLNFAILYNGCDEEDSALYADAILIPLKNGRYFITGGFAGTLQTNDTDLDSLAPQRLPSYDIRPFRANRRMGLSSRFGSEIIPDRYDSLRIEKHGFLVAAYLNKRITLYTPNGKMVCDSLKAACLVRDRYQVIDHHNRMCYIDIKGNRTDEYSFSMMSVDDQLYPLPYDVVIIPKNKRLDKSSWVHFIVPNDIYQSESLPEARKKNWNWFYADTLFRYGLDELEFNYITHSDEYFRYQFEIYELPDRYEQNVFANSNTTSYNRSGDYRQLSIYWVVACSKGKYGLYDVRKPDKPLLPFVYDRVTGIVRYRDTHLLLERQGLKCYYPISSKPRYKELEPFERNFARFTLPNGRKGWLGLDGKEYLDEAK